MEIQSGSIYSFIRDVPPELAIKIDNALTFPVKGVWFSPKYRKMIKSGKWDGKVHFYNAKTGRFPTGILPLMQKLSGFGKGDHLIDNRFPKDFSFLEAMERAKNIRLNGIDFSGFQYQSIINNVKYGRGLNKLATNAGKTEVGIGTVEALGLKALWLVHRKLLLRQCAERYELRTGNKAGMIGEGKFTIGERLTVASIQSLDPKTKQGKDFLKQFQVLIVDECQHAQANSWFSVCMNSPAPFRFGLSGSFPTDEIKFHRIMSATGSEILSEVRNEQLIEAGWSAKPTIFIRPVEYTENLMDYAVAYDKMIANNQAYNNLVIEDAIDCYKRGKITLIIVDRIRQGSYISQNIANRGVPCKFLTGGSDDAYRAKVMRTFKSGKTPIVIGTSIFDEGVDVPAIEALILAAGGRSDQRQLQRIGRALRKKEGEENTVEVYDYMHCGNQYLLLHGLERVELCKSEKFNIKWREAIKIDL